MHMEEIKVQYSGKDFDEINKKVVAAYRAVSGFFSQKPKKISVIVHITRKSYEKKLRRTTEDWEVANASYSGVIDILHPDSFVGESTHKKGDFLPILKHEFAHIFIDTLSRRRMMPRWLDEGFSSYVAGLKRKKELPNIQTGFCKTLGSLRGWNENVGNGAYVVSQSFVSFLIKEFSLNQVRAAIAASDKRYHFGRFEKKFISIFGKKIKEAEQDFLDKENKPSASRRGF